MTCEELKKFVYICHKTGILSKSFEFSHKEKWTIQTQITNFWPIGHNDLINDYKKGTSFRFCFPENEDASK